MLVKCWIWFRFKRGENNKIQLYNIKKKCLNLKNRMIQSKIIEQNIRMLLAKKAGGTVSGKVDLKKKIPVNTEISLY